MNDTKKLYAKEYEFIYETKFDKVRKRVAKNSGIWFLVFVLAYFPIALFMPLVYSTLILIVSFILMLNRLTIKDLSKREDYVKIGQQFVENSNYLVYLGDAVTSIDDVLEPPLVRKPTKKIKDKNGKEIEIPAEISPNGFNPDAILYPILMKDTMMLTHMFVIGTTGAGKTTFLVNILEQLLKLGGGCLAVDGKGDKSVYEAFYNTAVACGREDDFMVINFNVPTESNTMNPLLKGSADEITDIIGNMLETGGDNAFWSGRALAMMKGLLSILVPLRDAGILFNPNGEKVDVLTFSFLAKWIDMGNLKMLYFTIKQAIEIGALPDMFLGAPDENGITIKLSDEEKKRFPKDIKIDRLEQYLSSVYLNIHDPEAQIEEGTMKQHGNSFLMWNESLDLIAGRFGPIFDTDAPEIDMSDVVSNGRILYILLPALKVDARTLSVLGKLILGFFKQAVSILLGDKIAGSIDERYQGMAIRPRVPFWGVMDEYGAYAVEGFDNVLAQARSLRVSVCILVQEIASLKKSSEIEAQRLLGNMGIKVILKLEEQKSVEEVIGFLGKQEVATVRVTNTSSTIEERSLEVQEKDYLTPQMLKKLTGGHAYVMWAGQVVPSLVRYFEPPLSRVIPPFKEFSENIRPFYFRERYTKLAKQFLSENMREESIESKAERLSKMYGFRLNMNILDPNELDIDFSDKKVKEVLDRIKIAKRLYNKYGN